MWLPFHDAIQRTLAVMEKDAVRVEVASTLTAYLKAKRVLSHVQNKQKGSIVLGEKGGSEVPNKDKY